MIRYLILSIIIFQEIYSSHVIGLRVKYSSVDNISNNISFDKSNLGDGIYTWINMDFGTMRYINEMTLSKSFKNMLRGSKKEIRGFYGFSNQGYVQFEPKSINLQHQIKLGRSYINHGFSRSGKLLISNWSRPFDLISWKANYKNINAELVGAQLDQIAGNNRFLSMHAINFLFANGITLSFAESFLYAGADRGIELQYFNPTLFWVPIRENQDSNQGNSILYSGIKYSKENYELWLELILDDFQIDKEVREPASYGYITGINFKTKNKSIEETFIEYTKVTNRTYQAVMSNGAEDFLHRGFPIGHHLGNDFDYLHLSIFFKKIKLDNIKCMPSTSLSLVRDGFGGIETPWDSPWNDDDSFQEHFPTKPVKNIYEFELTNDFIFENGSNINFGLLILKEHKFKTYFLLKYWLEFDKIFDY